MTRKEYLVAHKWYIVLTIIIIFWAIIALIYEDYVLMTIFATFGAASAFMIIAAMFVGDKGRKYLHTANDKFLDE